MNIHKALRKKNEIVGEIAKLDTRVYSNRWAKDNEPAYDSRQVLEEREKLVKELVSLKSKISAASQEIFTKILLMEELKGLIKVLHSMPCDKGKEHGTYSASVVEYEVKITQKERDELVAKLEAEIRSIQEEIDAFNAKTEIYGHG
jgi:hypothetical protein